MERRISPRYRVSKQARFCLANRDAGHVCQVRDMSATGARLDLLADSVLPEDGILEIRSLELAFPVRLRWRRGDECGVEFSGPARAVGTDQACG